MNSRQSCLLIPHGMLAPQQQLEYPPTHKGRDPAGSLLAHSVELLRGSPGPDPPHSTQRLISNASSFQDSESSGQTPNKLEVLGMPHLGGACEGHFVHIWVGGNGSPSRGAKSRNNVDHARGKASLCGNSQETLGVILPLQRAWMGERTSLPREAKAACPRLRGTSSLWVLLRNSKWCSKQQDSWSSLGPLSAPTPHGIHLEPFHYSKGSYNEAPGRKQVRWGLLD